MYPELEFYMSDAARNPSMDLGKLLDMCLPHFTLLCGLRWKYQSRNAGQSQIEHTNERTMFCKNRFDFVLGCVQTSHVIPYMSDGPHMA